MHKYIQRTLIASIGISLLPILFRALNINISLLKWLALSSFGLKSWKLFQPFTAPLFFSLDLRLDALSLLTPLYMLFVAQMANLILDIDEPKGLLRFYLGSSIFTALTLFLFSYFTGHDFIYFGPQPFFYAIISYLLFIIPEIELILFIFPIRAKIFLWIGLALSLLFSLDAKDLTPFFATFSGAFFGYLFGLKKLRRHSCYPLLESFEKRIFSLFDLFKPKPKCVIVDFRTGQHLSK